MGFVSGSFGVEMQVDKFEGAGVSLTLSLCKSLEFVSGSSLVVFFPDVPFLTSFPEVVVSDSIHLLG